MTSESYEKKQIETKVAACMTALMHELGGRCTWVPGAWGNTGAVVDASQWRTEGDWPLPFTVMTKDDKGKTLWSHHDGRHSEYVRFIGAYYGSDSKITKSPPKQLEDVEVNVDEKSKVFTNFTDDTISVSYEESLTLTQSSEKTKASDFHWDVSETVEVGGEAYGVSASSSTTASTGGSESSSTTEGSSTEHAATVAINFELKPGEVVRVHILFNRSRVEQTVTGHFVMDWDEFEVKFNHWPRDKDQAKYRDGQENVKIKGVQGLVEFVAGRDTNYPHIPSHWVSRVMNGINRIKSIDTRSFVLNDTFEHTIEDNEDYKLETLHKDAIPPGVQVVDMSVEENQSQYGG